MASFVECSIRNKLSGDRLFDILEKYMEVYENTDIENRDKLVFGTTPTETKSLYARNEIKIHEILCKYAFQTYMKTVFWVAIWVVAVAVLIYTGNNQYASFAMGPLIVISFKYTKTCKNWLFQDKQKNWLKQNATKEGK